MTLGIILLFLTSFFLMPTMNGGKLAIGKEVAALTAGCMFLVGWLWKYNKWLAMCLSWVLIRSYLPPEQSRSLFTLANIVIGCIIYVAIRISQVDMKKVLEALGYITLAHIVVVLLQKYDLFMFWNAGNYNGMGAACGRVAGIMGNSNWSGAFIAINLPLLLWLGRDKKVFLLGLLGIPALFLLDSQFALLSGLVGVGVYLYIMYRPQIIKYKLDYMLLSGLITTTIYLVRHPILFDATTLDRMIFWNTCIDFITYGGNVEWRCHFVQGIGIGEAYKLLPRIYSSSDCMYFQTHNEYLQALLEGGLVMLVLVLGLIWNTLKRITFRTAVFGACFIAILLDAFGFFVFRSSPIGYLGIVYMALIDKESYAVL